MSNLPVRGLSTMRLMQRCQLAQARVQLDDFFVMVAAQATSFAGTLTHAACARTATPHALSRITRPLANAIAFSGALTVTASGRGLKVPHFFAGPVLWLSWFASACVIGPLS
jgi:hypothetical protein